MKIELKEYSAAWPHLFELERASLISAIGGFLQGSIEHIGSTSVRNMRAKPIIDIMFGVKDLESSKAAIEILEANGYCYYPYKPEQMHWFCKPHPENRTHHLHLVPYAGKIWQERIAFRNALRSSSKISQEYEALKMALASEFENDRESYTEKKWPFIKKVINGAENG